MKWSKNKNTIFVLGFIQGRDCSHDHVNTQITLIMRIKETHNFF